MEEDLVNVIKVTDLTLKWGDYPGLSEWFKPTTKSVKKRESEGSEMQQ